MKMRFALLCVVLAWAPFVLADDDHHHFDPSEKLGSVAFSTSCAASVQKSFERGVALLHSFGYEEAGEQFRKVSQKDPQCAIAYWGEAMSLYHQLWSRPSQQDLKQGWELMQKAQAAPANTGRERDYIDALAAFYRDSEKNGHEQRAEAYSQAMSGVYKKYPKDYEAAVLYALSLMGSATRTNQAEKDKAAIAILNKLFAEHPDHPGVAHYLIHSCDNPNFAREGLAAARRYAGIAPSSPHAIHMPSHIFARLGLWQDDIQSNLTAIDAANKQAAMHLHVMHHRIHSMDFLQYAYLQIGDDVRAKGMMDELATIRPEDLDAEFRPYLNGIRAHFAALYALERRQWKDAVNAQPPAGAEPYNAATTYWAQAIAAGHLHDAEAAHKALEQFKAMVEATRKSDRPYLAEHMDTDRDEAAAWTAFADGKNDDAMNLLRSVIKKQDETGKGEVALPAREMLADMLMELNRPQEALVEYEKSLKTDPNRFNGLYGAARAAELAQQPQKAAGYYAQLLKNCEHSDRPELERARTFTAKDAKGTKDKTDLAANERSK